MATLYLALLHAMTSSVLPDPFTGLTGTQEAMRILKQAKTFSCSPYCERSESILKRLAGLSPMRELYRGQFPQQVVTFPVALPSLAAHEGFAIAVHRLLNRANELRFLFHTSNEKTEEPNTLIQKAYWRYSEVMGCARMSTEDETSLVVQPNTIPGSVWTRANWGQLINASWGAKSIALLAQACYEWKHARRCVDLWSLLCSLASDIEGPSMVLPRGERGVLAAVNFWHSVKIGQSYLSMYRFAVDVGRNGQQDATLRHDFMFALSHCAYMRSPNPAVASSIATAEVWLDLIHSLLSASVATSNLVSSPPQVPNHNGYESISNYQYPADKVHSLISHWRRDEEELERRNLSRWEVDQLARSLENYIKNLWPSPTFAIPETVSFQYDPAFDISRLVSGLKPTWFSRIKNRDLFNFIAEVQRLLGNLSSPTNFAFPTVQSAQPTPVAPGMTTRFSCFSREGALNCARLIDQARAIYTDGCIPDLGFSNEDFEGCRFNSTLGGFFDEEPCAVALHLRENLGSDIDPLVDVQTKLTEVYDAYAARIGELEQAIRKAILPQRHDTVGQSLWNAGLWRNPTRTLLFPALCDSSCGEPLKTLLGALATALVGQQRIVRIMHLDAKNTSNQFNVLLKRELQNPGHQGWSPVEHPEWLLLELDGNFMIRKEQVDIALHMLHVNENLVCQLNMGDGKTSVIMPMVLASLSNTSRIGRAVVLRSLFTTNFHSLAMKLGGLLNRRLYSFPCARDLNYNAGDVAWMHQTYDYCLRNRGVIVTTPESCLSFELKVIEKCRNVDKPMAAAMLKLQAFIRDNCSDVLDESDEILNVKCQLLYTVGSQQMIDGGSARWQVIQGVFRLIKKFATGLVLSQGTNTGDYEYVNQGPAAFPRFRLLNRSLYKEMCDVISDGVLNRDVVELIHLPCYSDDEKAPLKKLIVSSDITSDEIEQAKTLVASTAHWEKFLILRGLVGFEILLHTLSQRWRVNYGVSTNPKSKTKMAVPFKAKDVASERTEFGHPDVAIVFTLLSYYQSGLNDEQLLDVFSILYKSAETAKDIYATWLTDIPAEDLESSMTTLDGINLSDPDQRTRLFRLLSKNMAVVDFYLSNRIFPMECKQFPFKLSASPWDFACHRKYPVVGFSGTNDSQLLLPVGISQRDLPAQLGTNKLVLGYLMRQENRRYMAFQSSDVSGVAFLRTMLQFDPKTRVLIDCGALMTDLSNKEVAREWLKLNQDPTITAAVYFDKKDVPWVVEQNGRSSPFDLSAFCNKLSGCVVYLDDVHTRGTDFRFPGDAVACVTLGKGLAKDKLAQSCMRMRLLGYGQSVWFFASKEVDVLIKSSRKDSANSGAQIICNQDVLRWCVKNTVTSIRDGLVHWVQQGASRCQKELALAGFQKTHDVSNYGTACTENEVTELCVFYGNERTLQSLSTIAERCVNKVVSHFGADLSHDETADCRVLQTAIITHCHKYSDQSCA